VASQINPSAHGEEFSGTASSSLGPAPADDKRALLRQLLTKRKHRSYPLSLVQERIWFIEQFYPGTSNQHILHVLRINARLEPELMQRAWCMVVERHDILRASFTMRDGVVVQTIHPDGAPGWESADFIDLPEHLKEKAAAEMAQRLFQLPFDLAKATLLRVGLFWTRPDESIMTIVLHHIISDNNSVETMLREARGIYESLLAGHRPALPDPAVQYGEFASWQRLLEADADHTVNVAWWRRQLQDFHQLEIPLSRPRRAHQSEPGKVSRVLSPELTGAIRKLQRQQGVTAFMLMLAAFKSVLSVYGSHWDIAIGTVVTGRNRPELKDAVGPYMNDLVLRTDLSGDPEFRELLRRVRRTVVDAFSHQDVPFELLVRELKPVRDPLRHPFFDVLFLFLQEMSENIGEGVGTVDVGHSTAKLDLSHLVIEERDRFVLIFEYDSSLLDKETIEGLAEAVEIVLTRAVADPDTRLTDLVASELECAEPEKPTGVVSELDATLNNTTREWSAGTVVDMVQAQFEARGADLAMREKSRNWSYALLDSESARVANHLRAIGIGREDIVAVCMNRSAGQIAALMGILIAGAAYLPVAPKLPAERICYILKDSGALLLIGDLTPEGWEGRSVRMDDMRLATDDRRLTKVNPDGLAYVIYTSGSTGRPKGVMITHRGLANLVRWQMETYSVHPGQRGAYLSGLGFDATVLEIWAYLAAGASIAIPPEEARINPPVLRDWITANRITLAFAPTPLAEKLMDLNWEQTSLTGLLTGGDRLTKALPSRIPWRLWNNYGPTETTVVATSTPVIRETAIHPIGSPIANTRCYILDAEFRPMAAGEVGELFIAGVGLARGYLGKSALTAERFVPNPFGAAGERLYRTGDMVRRLSSGQLEFVGRADNQIKIRGYRIEAGEIEVVLQQLPGLETAVVIARSDVGRAPQLVAYILWRNRSEALSPSEVRARLAERLPDYMVPTAIVRLDELPLNPNGKIDRSALPRPSETDRSLEPPMPGIETILAELWGQLLGLEKVGRNETFLELGGHSLVATQLTSRIRVRFGMDVPLGDILGPVTLAEQAQSIVTWQQSSGKAGNEPALERISRSQPLPCSYAQERMWLLQQLEPKSSAYNFVLPVRVRGPLDARRLEGAITALLAKQEALRTVIVDRDGKPCQQFDPVSDRPLNFASAASEQEAFEMVRAEAKIPFDLAKGPLARWTLIEIAPDDQVFLIVLHHIVIDGWSLGILLNQLTEAYDGPERLAELPIQYGDYAVWQRRWLDEARINQQLVYWRRTLDGAAPLLELPLDRARPQIQGLRAAVHRFELGSKLTAQLRGFAKEHGATLFMVLLAGFKALLHRLSGQTDIVLATPVAGRDRQEMENIVGFFVNTLVLRTDLSGDPSFSELLDRVRDTALGAYSHQHLPFHRLVEELAPQRNSAWDPMVQAMFELQNVDGFHYHIKGIELEIQPIDQHMAKFDLALIVTEAAQETNLPAVFEYRTDLFDHETIERLGNQWIGLLEAALEQPAESIEKLDFAGHEETLPTTSIASAVKIRGDVVALIASWAERQPNHIALVDEERSWSYTDLVRESERIARHLRFHGIGTESLVAIQIERSGRQIASMLAVLMSGAAYLPIDTGYPKDRVAYMLQDSGAIPLEAILDQPCEAEETEPWLPIDPDSLAYVIYTSGSTGHPKGVMISHANLLNQTLWMQDCFSLGPGDRVIYKASAGFDASLLETIIPIALGCTVEILPTGREYDVEYIAAFLRERAVTYMDIVPSLLQSLLLLDEFSGLPALRIVTCGGEILTLALAEKIGQRLSGALFNTYGPTETTVQSTYWGCRLPASGSSVPIGLPITNTQCYILDGRMRQVPTGVVGELYIGGAGVARGYLKRPALTAERFCPNPFAADGGRLYRTGDLVRRRTTGELEFIGRADSQVKLRGFRIELGEIEAALVEAAGVSDAFVVMRDDWGPSSILAGYILKPSGEALPSSEEVRRRLALRLPEYMLPTAIVEIDHIPVTPHGKVDRKAFPKPTLLQETWDAPCTPTEQILASIWERLLEVPVVSRNDNFFALGGHSLLTTQVVSRIRLELGVELPLRTLFDHPRLADLAREIEAARSLSVAGDDGPALEAVDSTHGVMLSFAQQRLWFLHQWSPDSSSYNIPLQIRICGPFNADRLERVIQRSLERHEILRTVFVENNGQPLQVVRALEDHPLVRTKAASGQHAKALAQADAELSFNLSTGPLVRWTLVEITPEEHLFLITLHHIVTDGWSMHLLFNELASGYRSDQMAPKPRLQYSAYASWQRAWLSGERLEKQIEYWRARLDNVPPLLELPTDFARPAVQSLEGATYRVSLDFDLIKHLRKFAHEQGTTLFTVLLGSYQVLLCRYTNQTDISVGTPVAGRNRIEFEDMMGLFVNTLVLRTGLDDSPSIVELVARTKETALGAWTHQDVPFEQLVEEFVKERSFAYVPLVQVMFAVQRTPRVNVSSEIAFEVEELELHSAKFDLTLTVHETESPVADFEYRTDLFLPATIERMARSWQAILRSFVERPATRIDEIPLLDASEMSDLLGDRMRTIYPAPDANLLPDLIAEHVATRPAELALLDSFGEWTYQEMEEQSNRLARLLQLHGARQETLVAVYLPRSAQQVIALLAVMKTGAAYMPVDLAYPVERVLTMLRDAVPVVLISSETIAEWQGITINPDEALNHSAGPLQVRIHPQQLAYVIYTSGSTGRPKGVMISHASLANVVRWQIREAALKPADRGAYFCGLGFDVSILDLWAPLASGASVAIPTDEIRQFPERFRDWLLEQQVTVTFASTLIAEKLLELQWPAITALRILITGGDRLAKRPPSNAPWRFWNLYGPTEATVLATCGEVSPEGNGLPSIGHSIANVQCYVLDDQLNPVPIGVIGELYIGGTGVGRGYLKQPRFTAERFVPDPFGTAGGRLYRTGDLVRRQAHHNIDFVGRNDRQIKLRGFRIELAEIEATLNDVPGVDSCAVLLRDDIGSSPALAAYVVMQTDHQLPSDDELRSHLAVRLPEWMLPAVFVGLPALPVNASGKVDRKLLPSTTLREYTVWEAPLPGIEQKLAAIWSEVLRVENIGRSDSFFALGGHSLLATQIVARIAAKLDIAVPLRALFENPRLQAFALRVAESKQLSGPALVRIENREAALVSFGQQRLWFLDQLEPGSSAYNIAIQSQLVGTLDVVRLEAAIRTVLQRHEVLRAVYAQRAEHVAQVVAEPCESPLVVVEIASEEHARELARIEGAKPFDLFAGPVARWTLIRFNADLHWFLITVHHIAFDAWSLRILISELSLAYEGKDAGPALTVQYADYADWQYRCIEESLESELKWWRGRMAGAPPLIELPLDRQRPLMQRLDGAAWSIDLDGELMSQLQALATAQDATLYMVLLAGFLALLSRYGNQRDLVVGTAISGRDRVELEALIGLFVNTLPLRTDLSGNPSFTELLARMRATVIEAQEHRQVPFERLIEELAPQRTLAYAPVVQVMFAFEGTMPTNVFSGLEVDPLPSNTMTAKFDLTLHVQERTDRLTVSFEYRTDIFDEATVAQLGRHLKQLLSGVAQQPQLQLEHISLLDEAERASLLTLSCGRNLPPCATTVPEAIAARAQSSAAAPALVEDSTVWNFKKLDTEANRIANSLLQLGIGAEDIVAVQMPRSARQIAALLGVMKAGAAYLPIDPDYPEERIRYMLEDANARITIDEARFASWSDADSRAVRVQIHFDQLAYLIYTSGSTGFPKAVGVTHRNLADLVAWHVDQSGITPLDRGSYCAGLGFDAAVWELWPMLAVGASVAVAPEAARLDPERFRDWIVRDAVTVPFAPTPLAEKMLDLVWPDGAALRLVNTGGDRLTKRQPAGLRWQLMNNYGPTETTVVAACTTVDPHEEGLPPIGMPVANGQCYILDTALEPVPTGASGELYLGGAGVARGYCGKPSLTAERFVPNPFGVPGSRLYRSGDLARRRRDGQIEFLGRADDQIKLRGIRIELGEIESSLRRIRGVAEAIACLQQSAGGEPLLAAYVVAAPDSVLPGAADLRKALAEQLPEYMIPAIVTELPQLPLTANGKLNRKALPRIVENCPVWEAPAAGLETQIAEIWQHVLRVENIGRHDSFFALGGHSLLATRVISRMEAELGIDLPVATFFRSPGLKSFAEEAGYASVAQHQAPLLRLSHGERDPLIFVHGIDGGLAVYLGLAQHLPADRAIFGLSVPPLDELRTIATLEALAEHHAHVLLENLDLATYTLAGWSYGGLLALEIAKSLQLKDKKTKVIMIDTHIPTQTHIEDGQTLRLLHPAGAPAASAHLFKENLRLLAAYQPKYFDGEALLIRASLSDPGPWSDFVRELRVEPVEGGHYDIMRAPRVQKVGAKL